MQPSEPPDVPEPTRKMDDVPFDDSPDDFQDEPIPDDFDGFGDEPFDGEPPVAEPAPTAPEPAPTPVRVHAEPAKTEPAPVEAEIHEPVAPEPVDSEDLKPILIRVTEDLPEFVGPDRDYKLFKEDLVMLPKVLADVLINSEKAMAIRPTP